MDGVVSRSRTLTSSIVIVITVLIVLDGSVCEVSLSLDASFYHIRITTEQLQELNESAVLAVALSRLLHEQERILDAGILGQERKFEINSTSLTVHPINPVSPGRHNMDIIIIIGVQDSMGFVLSAPLTVDVIAKAGESCTLQPFGKCSHFCTEEIGSAIGYTCSCEVGYSLQLDGFVCLANDPMPLLLFSDSNGILDFFNLFRQSSLLLSNNSVSLFDYRYHDKVLFYVYEHRSIMFTSLMPGEMEFELHHIDSGVAGGLVYDWINDAIIFSNLELGVIAKISISTEEMEVMFSSIERPRKLAIQGNITEQKLSWIEGEAGSTMIKVVSMSTREILLIVENFEDDPVDIDIDVVTGRLYWITANGRLQSYSKTKIETICEFKDSAPSSLSVFEVYAYVISNHSIVQVDLLKPEDRFHKVYEVNSSISDLSVYHPLKQPNINQGTNALNCSECDQLCLVAINSVQCGCIAGYVLSLDGHSCYPSDTFQLFLTSSVNVNGLERGIVVSASLDGVQQAQIVDSSFGKDQSPITGLVFALAFDISSNSIFFGDRNSSTLWRVSIDRMTDLQDNREQLAEDIHAWGMAYDWIHQTLYWTDDRNMSVGKLQLSSAQSNGTETVLTGLQSPRGIAVDPINEWIYWVEASETPAISRKKLYGKYYQVLINSDLRNPTGLAIDFISGSLYWGDIGKIETIDLVTLKRKAYYLDPDLVPFQLTTVRDYVAFTITDRTKYCLFEVDRALLSMISLQSNNPANSVYGITALSQSKEPTKGQYLCYFNSLNCSHFCNTDENDSPSCGCPVAYSLLEDQATCSYEDECPVCTNGGTCNVHGRAVSCSCAAGFTGDECTEDCPPDTFGLNCNQQCNCVNGMCNSRDGSCQCLPQYSGELCNEPVCSQICKNGGTCITPDQCLCQETYSGPSCETRICTPDYCFNGGTCFVDFDVDLSCRCPTTASGPQCQFNNNITFIPLSGSELGAAIGVPLVVVIVILLSIVAIVTLHYIRLSKKKSTIVDNY